MADNRRPATETDSSSVEKRSRGSRKMTSELRAQERGRRDAERLQDVIRALQQRVYETEVQAQGREEQLMAAQLWCQEQAQRSLAVEDEAHAFQEALHVRLLTSRQEMVNELEVVRKRDRDELARAEGEVRRREQESEHNMSQKQKAKLLEDITKLRTTEEHLEKHLAEQFLQARADLEGQAALRDQQVCLKRVTVYNAYS